MFLQLLSNEKHPSVWQIRSLFLAKQALQSLAGISVTFKSLIQCGPQRRRQQYPQHLRRNRVIMSSQLPQ